MRSYYFVKSYICIINFIDAYFLIIIFLVMFTPMPGDIIKIKARPRVLQSKCKIYIVVFRLCVKYFF